MVVPLSTEEGSRNEAQAILCTPVWVVVGFFFIFKIRSKLID